MLISIKNIKKIQLYLDSDKPIILFYLVINVALPPNSGWNFNIYEQKKFNAQLSLA